MSQWFIFIVSLLTLKNIPVFSVHTCQLMSCDSLRHITCKCEKVFPLQALYCDACEGRFLFEIDVLLGVFPIRSFNLCNSKVKKMKRRERIHTQAGECRSHRKWHRQADTLQSRAAAALNGPASSPQEHTHQETHTLRLYASVCVGMFSCLFPLSSANERVCAPAYASSCLSLCVCACLRVSAQSRSVD